MEHRHAEEPLSFSVIQVPPTPSNASALPDTPLPGSSNEQTQARNLRPVKLMPLGEMESALEP